MTLDDLRSTLIECAGTDGPELQGDIAHVAFADLGYDSLAVMETVARLRQRFGVSLDYERAIRLHTPAEMLAAFSDAEHLASNGGM
jgi:act minimal PKS acyl carrier protein